MARAEVEPQRDDLDALFEVDQGMDDIFDTVRRDQAAEKNGARALQNEVQYGRKRTDAANDVDEEIKITKKRAPIAKLDDTRWVRIETQKLTC